MVRFDRYIVTQLLGHFGVFCLILVALFWINRAVILFDQLIANGHPLSVFLGIASLSLPNVIRLVLPIAGFAATVWCFNRLNSDSELLIIQATGYSPWRLLRPVLAYGVILAVLMGVLTHWLVPASLAEINKRQAELSRDMTARFLREGEFIHPASGITFFVGDVTPDGLLEDVFLEDRREDGETTVYNAQRALLVREGDAVNLVMLGGMAQTLSSDGTQLATTGFSDLLIDVTQYVTPPTDRAARPDEMTSWAILTSQTELPTAAKRLLHERFGQSLLALVAALVGASSLLTGGFSRFGLWRQIGLAVGLLIVIKLIDNTALNAAINSPLGGALAYAGPLAGLALTVLLLWYAARPRSVRRKRVAEVPA